MKSEFKSEGTRPMAAVRDQRCPPSPAIKSEFAHPPQPHTAAFSCEYCGKEFNLKQYLIRHIIEIHGDSCKPVNPEPYPIQSVSSESCKKSLHGKQYSSSSNDDIADLTSNISLPPRLESSSVELQKNYIPQGCFNENEIQNEQIVVHNSTKLFSCDVCQKSFSQEGNLKRHLLIHSGVKPYSCEVCKKNFSLKGGLNKHMLTHNGGKPYTCEVCQKNFRAKGTLN
eukprot:204351_1